MNQGTVTITKPEMVQGDGMESIKTWIYIALVIIILIAGYNLWYFWQKREETFATTISGMAVLGLAVNVILLFGSIIGIFAVWNGSIGCTSNVKWVTKTTQAPGYRRSKISEEL